MIQQEKGYYTPELEEFCVGFEYEYRYINVDGSDSWIHGKVDFNANNHFASIVRKNLENGNVRAKLLGRADIEAEGWDFETNEKGGAPSGLHFTKGIKYHGGNAEAKLAYIPETNWVIIYIGYDVTRFSGTIRNRTEFRKLLKQLGI